MTFWSGFWSTGWDKWSLMGHPVTKSSPYGSDVKTCTWLKSVCWSWLSGSTSLSYRPCSPDLVSVTHQFEWWDGQYYQIVALEQTCVCFCIDKMTLNFSCKNYTTKCQFLTLVKHFYLSGVDEFRAKTAQNWQFVKKKSKKYEIIN